LSPRTQQFWSVDAALHAGLERLLQAAVDVEVAVEVGLEQADVAEAAVRQ
jgi:hypothetical protein